MTVGGQTLPERIKVEQIKEIYSEAPFVLCRIDLFLLALQRDSREACPLHLLSHHNPGLFLLNWGDCNILIKSLAAETKSLFYEQEGEMNHEYLRLPLIRVICSKALNNSRSDE